MTGTTQADGVILAASIGETADLTGATRGPWAHPAVPSTNLGACSLPRPGPREPGGSHGSAPRCPPHPVAGIRVASPSAAGCGR
ncbi:hypothetical protein GCM10022294_02220 [Dietzia aurantiaca]